MTSRPRYALTRQMHFFGELKAVAEELRQKVQDGRESSGQRIEDMAWREALQRRRARLATAV